MGNTQDRNPLKEMMSNRVKLYNEVKIMNIFKNAEKKLRREIKWGRKQKQEVANRRSDLGKQFFKQYGRRIMFFSIIVIYPNNK